MGVGWGRPEGNEMGVKVYLRTIWRRSKVNIRAIEKRLFEESEEKAQVW